MGDYIRKPTVFNRKSERQMRIWHWIINRTGNFSDQNYSDFVRDKLEWCMFNEGKELKQAELEIVQPEEPRGWSKLI